MTGFAHLASVFHGTLASADGDTVTYTNVAGTVATVCAIQGQSRHDTTNEYGALIKVSSKDFLIKVSELEAAGIDKPRHHDTISLNGQTYLVAPVVSGSPAWEFSDHQNKLYRIHTQGDS